MKHLKKTTIALALANLVFVSATSTAADAPAAPAAATAAVAAAPVAQAAATAAAAPVASDDPQRIVVSATRRDTMLQDTPLAITAYSQETLQNNQVKDLASLVSLVPSLLVEQHGDSGGVHVYLRGVGSANHTELGDPAVAFYIDGIYLPRPQGATALMYDLSRVEVARGPQGTLNGRNSTAGSVSLISGAPSTSKVFGSASVTMGNYRHHQVQAMVNLPLGEDVALRIATIKDTHDGYVDFRKGSNVLPGAAKYGAGNQDGVRASLLWNVTPDLKATLIADYFKDTGAGNIYLQAEPGPQKLRSALVDTPGTMDQQIMAYKAKVQYKPSENTQIQYLGSWSRYQRQNANDADAGLMPGFKAENRTEWSTFDSNSNELQFRSDSNDAFQWIVGAFLFNEKNKIRFDIDRSAISAATLAQSIANNSVIFVQPTVGQYASAMSFIQPDRQLKSKSVFFNLSQDISKEIKLTGGMRYTKDDKSDVGGRNWACPNWPNPGVFGQPTAANQLVTPGAGLVNTHNIGPGGVIDATTCGRDYQNTNDATLSYSKLTYLARGEYKLDKDSLLFASVTSGFHSPAMGDGGATTKPESLTSYELGYKADMLNNMLTLNLDAFIMKYKDKLESQVVNNVLANFNAAGATVKGVEAEFSFRPSKQTRIMGNATWLKAVYDSFMSCDVDSARANGQSCGSTAPLVDVGGSVMKHAPSFAATVQFEHDIALGSGSLTPRASVHYEGKSFIGSGAFSQDVPGHPGVKNQAAYSTVDLSLRFAPNSKAYTLEAFVNNATDKAVKLDVNDLCGDLACTSKQQLFGAFYNAPRTMGARVSMKF
jgi:iron complex outermembrane receptor protein